MVIVVIIIILVKAFYVGNPSSSEQMPDKDSNVAKSWYDMSEERFTFEDILGASLPKTAVDKHANATFVATVGKEAKKIFWIVATLPKEDYHVLVKSLNFKRAPDLLKFWPEAFSCSEEELGEEYWDVKNSVNDETYYGENPEYKAQMVIKYERSKIYFKKEILYIEAGTDESGSTVYKKLKRSNIEQIY